MENELNHMTAPYYEIYSDTMKKITSSMFSSMSNIKKKSLCEKILNEYKNLINKIELLEQLNFEKENYIREMKFNLDEVFDLNVKLNKSESLNLELNEKNFKNQEILFNKITLLQVELEKKHKKYIQIKEENIKNLLNLDKMFENLLSLQGKYLSIKELDKNKVVLDSNVDNLNTKMKDENIQIKNEYKKIKKENLILLDNILKMQNKLDTLDFSKDNKYYVDNLMVNNKLGAADIVKNSFTYKVGNKLIEFKKRKKYNVLVKDIPKIALEFYAENIRKEIELINDLACYSDASEAERIKNHLSYGIGKVLLEGLLKPDQINKIPKQIVEEILLFNYSAKRVV